jgi:aspartate kinase
LLDAELITIWKDVPGVLSADPKKFKDPTLYSEINYHEAIEMAYFGASVIHPKTIQPLQEKNIPLFVRPFENPKEIGTKISNKAVEIDLQPNIIHKNNQVLISLSAKDYEFVAESHISDIFNTLAEWNWQVNLMQNGAVSFSICCDMQERNFEHLISELTVNYKVRYNKNLELFTIRHYKNSVLTELNSREILLEQKSRNTIQYLVKSTNS